MGADQHAGLSDVSQQPIELVSAAATLDWIAPHEHRLHPAQLGLDLIGKSSRYTAGTASMPAATNASKSATKRLSRGSARSRAALSPG